MTARKKKAKRPSSGGRFPPTLSLPRLRTMFAEYNPRRINAHEYEELRWSIRTFGYVQLVVCNKRTRAQGWPAGSRPTIVGGHQGVRASEEEGFRQLPVHWVDVDAVLEKKLNLTLNRVHGEFIAEQVENLLRDLKAGGDPLDHVGFTDDEVEGFLSGKTSRRDVDLEVARRTLRERFVVPPFSVLDARQGYWRQRKAAWLALGIQSELGRAAMIPGSTVSGARGGTATAPRAAGNYVTGRKGSKGAGAPGNAGRDASGVYADHGSAIKKGKKTFKPALHLDHAGESNEYVDRGGALLLTSDSGRDPGYYDQKRTVEKRLGRKLTTAEFQRDHYVPNEGATGLSVSGTSVFDPVLCELVYRWFTGPGARVLDPFAGGSVRGVVAGLLGRAYVGVDLSERQVAANDVQAKRIVGSAMAPPPAQAAEEYAWEATTSVTNELTPVQKPEKDIWLKRDDLLELAGVRGGKVRTCWELARGEKNGLVTAGSRSSPQVNIVAQIAAELGIGCRIHTPSGKIGPELSAATAAGADLVQHKAGRNPVIIARAREDAKERGWREIPFGMECAEAVEQTRGQVKRLPSRAKRIVVAVGSGMTLAGILHGIQDRRITKPVLGVRVGADPTKRLDKYAPEGWRSMVELVDAEGDYHEPATETQRWGIEFDPYYEAKALPHVQAGDLFWVVGIRQTAVPAPPPQPVSAATWKVSARWASKQVDCTAHGIAEVCGGRCCKSQVFWPPTCGEDGCEHLEATGCTLDQRDKPVICLLYPLMLNKTGTLVLHNRLPTKTAPCGENYGQGPTVVEALADNLTTLFGKAESDRIRAEVEAGRDVHVPVSQDLVDAVEREAAWMEENAVPEPRSQFRGATPPAVALRPTKPSWVVGDSRDLDALVPSGLYDLLFTCPPYYDLERYTDEPADLSTAPTYEEFLEGYGAIIERAARRLAKNRFAVLVVGEIRDTQRGVYQGLVPDTIRLAEKAGLKFYNDAVLVTTHGSLPVRAGRAFESSRKLGKTHQNVLVFIKGDWKKAAADLGTAEFGKGEELTEAELAPPAV